MEWQQWFYLGFATLGVILTASQVGKREKVLTSEVFAIRIVIQALLVWLVLSI